MNTIQFGDKIVAETVACRRELAWKLKGKPIRSFIISQTATKTTIKNHAMALLEKRMSSRI